MGRPRKAINVNVNSNKAPEKEDVSRTIDVVNVERVVSENMKNLFTNHCSRRGIADICKNMKNDLHDVGVNIDYE